MNVEKRIFVVGTPRSGTTLVQSLLSSHSSLTSFTESHFFSRHFRLVGSRPLLVKNPAPRLRKFLLENGSSAPIDSFPVLQTRAATERFVRLLDALAVERNRCGWVEKTPGHLRYVQWVQRVIPEVRCVHVIRKGLDVVASLHHASRDWERAYDLDECARRWNDEIAYSLTRVEKDIFVFYEKLTRHPERVVRRLVKEVGLLWEDSLVGRRHQVGESLVTSSEHWKQTAEREIAPSTAAARTLSDSQRERALRTLRLDRYDQLLKQVGP